MAKKNFYGYVYDKPEFKTVLEAVADYQAQVNKLLIVYENLMMTKVTQGGINLSYYQLWLSEQRYLTRLIINLRRRIERLKANNPSESRQINPLTDEPVDLSQKYAHTQDASESRLDETVPSEEEKTDLSVPTE